MSRSRSSVLARAALTVLALMILGACTLQDPEITENDQVPADAREEEAPADDGTDAGDGGADGGDGVTVTAIDIAYEDPPSSAPAGEVAFQLVNEGAAEHNIVVEELGDEPIVEAAGGQTESATVALEAGSYTLYCSIPGHRPTMEFTLEVQ